MCKFTNASLCPGTLSLDPVWSYQKHFCYKPSCPFFGGDCGWVIMYLDLQLQQLRWKWFQSYSHCPTHHVCTKFPLFSICFKIYYGKLFKTLPLTCKNANVVEVLKTFLCNSTSPEKGCSADLRQGLGWCCGDSELLCSCLPQVTPWCSSRGSPAAEIGSKSTGGCSFPCCC